MFGWIPVLWKISQAEVLATAGYDAYAFLSFFRFAIKYLCIILFFSVTVILPVNERYSETLPKRSNSTHGLSLYAQINIEGNKDHDGDPTKTKNMRFYWMHAVFTYAFTALAFYLMIDETKKMIRIRQAYMGTQSTVTDRTIRLSGIPPEMRSEDRIQKFIEDLGIGRVESVMLCRNWRKLDDMMAERMRCLRRLETAWANYYGQSAAVRYPKLNARQCVSRRQNGEHTTALLSQQEAQEEDAAQREKKRPMHTVRYGFLNLKSRKIDAIDFHEEHLRRLDNAITTLRCEEFEPTALAFVTMQSTSSCQMAVQAILNPVPGELVASLAPPPTDVVWANTYMTRNQRMLRSWLIMILVGLLAILWAALLTPLGVLLSPSAIDEILPGLAQVLKEHEIIESLVRTGLPTLAISLLAIAVPYVYEWLSNRQGMTSQGDVEDSIISKNFFFTFFNLFLLFTIWGSAVSFFQFWDMLGKLMKDATYIAHYIAESVIKLSSFYTNLIILQGIGLFPFRLLEFGTVALYPFYLLSAKTPRDHAELIKAPVFSYGFYLPQTLLIFVMCITYSVLPQSWLIILFGLIYFIVGGFIYKFQLLYAMEHQEHSTGRAWPMVCNRIIMGLVIFHATMGGVLLLNQAFTQALTMMPLLVATIWFTVYFQRTYFPLMRFMALKSINNQEATPIMPTPTVTAFDRATDHGRAVHRDPETDSVRYANPNLVCPLEPLWIRRPAQDRSIEDG